MNKISSKLGEESILLLRKLFMSTHDQAGGLAAIKFRADNYQYRGLIDALVEGHFIEERDGKYSIKLLALTEIESCTPQVGDLLAWCERLFVIAREAYLKSPGEDIKVTKLVELSALTKQQVVSCLPYMAETSIFGGWTTDPNANDAFVRPVERILDYESFSQIVEERRNLAWKTTAISPPAPKSYSSPFMDWSRGTSDFSRLLHPEIIAHGLAKYQDGHLRNAVLDSVIAVFDLIRKRTGLSEDGDELIGKAFSLSKPYLILSEIGSESGQNDQKGFMQIFKGVFQGIRNPKAHTLSGDLTEIEAAQYLVLASLLARRVEEAVLVKQDQ